MGPDIELLVLISGAGLQVVEGLSVEGGPVADGAVQIANVDVVEVVLRPGPVQLGIVDDKLAVMGHPRWLDWGYIRADDLASGVLVGEVFRRLLLACGTGRLLGRCALHGLDTDALSDIQFILGRREVSTALTPRASWPGREGVDAIAVYLWSPVMGPGTACCRRGVGQRGGCSRGLARLGIQRQSCIRV